MVLEPMVKNSLFGLMFLFGIILISVSFCEDDEDFDFLAEKVMVSESQMNAIKKSARFEEGNLAVSQKGDLYDGLKTVARNFGIRHIDTVYGRTVFRACSGECFVKVDTLWFIINDSGKVLAFPGDAYAKWKGTFPSERIFVVHDSTATLAEPLTSIEGFEAEAFEKTKDGIYLTP